MARGSQSDDGQVTNCMLENQFKLSPRIVAFLICLLAYSICLVAFLICLLVFLTLQGGRDFQYGDFVSSQCLRLLYGLWDGQTHFLPLPERASWDPVGTFGTAQRAVITTAQRQPDLTAQIIETERLPVVWTGWTPQVPKKNAVTTQVKARDAPNRCITSSC
jgi:hypothetical protein